MGAFYKSPHFISEDHSFESNTEQNPLKLKNIAAYLDVKYEPPFFQGSYMAYRIDGLAFGKMGNANNNSWDNNVFRHAVALGYHANRHVLLRLMASTQHVDNKKWDKTQRTFQAMLTVHY